MEETRSMMLNQLLTPEAKARCKEWEYILEVAGIALVKPEKAQSIENSIIRDAQLGKIMGKLTDAQVILKIEEFDAAAAKTILKVILSFEYRA